MLLRRIGAASRSSEKGRRHRTRNRPPRSACARTFTKIKCRRCTSLMDTRSRLTNSYICFRAPVCRRYLASDNSLSGCQVPPGGSRCRQPVRNTWSRADAGQLRQRVRGSHTTGCRLCWRSRTHLDVVNNGDFTQEVHRVDPLVVTLPARSDVQVPQEPAAEANVCKRESLVVLAAPVAPASQTSKRQTSTNTQPGFVRCHGRYVPSSPGAQWIPKARRAVFIGADAGGRVQCLHDEAEGLVHSS